ncbi:MAG: tRNA pseudouridine(38-40) synthase TruA [Thermoguttaceae bacterium]|nr:tRNA pseudouridine(38-40) synthase TruA [Thermoguttaceae bacterium]
MRRVKLELCYDGGEYAGWQIQKKQPNVRTIQEELEKAIRRVVGADVEVLGSGRTDAGVHALYQVAAFSTESTLPCETLTRAINAFLPPDVRIWRSTDVAEDFHPIRDVVRKRYRYLLSDARPAFPFWRRNAWNLRERFDDEAAAEAARHLLGTFDFAAFQTQGSPRKTTVRTVYDVRVERRSVSGSFAFPKALGAARPDCLSDWEAVSGVPRAPFGPPSLISVEVEANGFLYNMVRSIVGTLFLFATRHKGFENPETMRQIVDSADRRNAGPTAPPWGLYMLDVIYPDEIPAEEKAAKNLPFSEKTTY